MLNTSLRALLAHSIDYAGMFPPCRLALEPALKNQADYVRSEDSWMLNAFVLSVAAFPEAEPYLVRFDPTNPLRISALGPKTSDIAEFRQKLGDAVGAIRRLHGKDSGRIIVPQLEMFLPAGVDSAALADVGREIKDLNVQAFWETPPAEAPRAIELLAQHNAATDSSFGYKLRTGGVTADAFPKSEEIAAALVASAEHDLAIKFTAGLHHPLRQFRDEVKTKMHGFLNVLGAAVLAREHKWDEKTTVTMLEDEDPGSFSFGGEMFAWQGWKISASVITARRKHVMSFGSCSFDEPREDLRALKLL